MTINEKLQGLRQVLEVELLYHKDAVLLWSGGRDSQLLLHLILEFLPSIPIIQFRADWRKEQKVFADSVIAERDLHVISFQPLDRSVLASGDGLILVDDYLINGERFPVIRDIVHSDEYCTLEYSKAKTEEFPFVYSFAIVGWKKTDKQTILDFDLPKEITIGGARFFAPLFELTDEEVAEMCKLAGVKLSEFYADGDEKKDTGSFVACSNCLKDEGKVFCPKEGKKISGFNWDKEAALKAFQSRFVEV